MRRCLVGGRVVFVELVVSYINMMVIPSGLFQVSEPYCTCLYFYVC